MALLEKQLEIKQSNIPGAGLGLFTKEFIAKGSRIVQYKGRKRTWKDVKGEDGNYFIFYVTRNYIIDASNYLKSFARYINDASGLKKIMGLRNNTEFLREGDKVFVEATRDIPAGGELFVGYGKEYWQVVRENIKTAKIEEKKAGKKSAA